MRLILPAYLFSFFISLGVGYAAPVDSPNKLPATNLQVFILDPELLEKGREAINRNEPRVMPATMALRAAANKVVNGRVYSVVNKTMLPPSGDKHDYMSMGTYWWPNPNTPDGLPYIKRDGQANPEIKGLRNDKDLENMIRDVETTALAYYFFQDEKYAHKAALLIRTWFLSEDTRMNPNLNYSQAIPGVSEGRGLGIIDSRNLPVLIDAIGLLQNSPNWSEKDQQGMEDWFSQYLTWLQESKNGIAEAQQKNNHGTWYDGQVASLALFLNKKNLAKEVLQTALTKRLAVQIQPDGRQTYEFSRTLSWTYSVMNLIGLFNLASMAEKVEVDWWHYKTADGRNIRQALDFMIPYATAEKTWEGKQIKVLDAPALYPSLLRAAVKYKNAGYVEVADKIADKRMLNHKCNLTSPVLEVLN